MRQATDGLETARATQPFQSDSRCQMKRLLTFARLSCQTAFREGGLCIITVVPAAEYWPGGQGVHALSPMGLGSAVSFITHRHDK